MGRGARRYIPPGKAEPTSYPVLSLPILAALHYSALLDYCFITSPPPSDCHFLPSDSFLTLHFHAFHGAHFDFPFAQDLLLHLILH
jgi:hypothetical protein